MAWIAQVAIAAYGAYQGSKANKDKAKAAAAGQNEVSYRTPYMNEYISQIAPYILGEATKMYSSRLGNYSNMQGGKGYKPGDFSPIAARLAGIPLNYSGVGKPGAPIYNGSSAAPAMPFRPNSFTSSYGPGTPPTEEQQLARHKYIQSLIGPGRAGGGSGMADRGGMADAGPMEANDSFTEYWR